MNPCKYLDEISINENIKKIINIFLFSKMINILKRIGILKISDLQVDEYSQNI